MPVQYYGNRPRLLPNQRYVVTVHLPGGDHVFSFTSRFDPAFCTLKSVQLELQGVLDVPAEAIGWQIWQVSQELVRRAEQATTPLPSPPNEVLRAACRYRVAVALLLRALTGRALSAGSETKRLRDLTVTLQVDRPQAEALLSHWKALADQYEAQLFEVASLARPFVKAGNIAYPLVGRLF